MKFQRIILLLSAFVVATSYGATFYVDFVGGSDANNGTSTATPWKRAPWMQSFAGAFTTNVASGGTNAVFIFKGGVTWPVACFPMRVYRGGDTEAQRLVFKADAAWFTGGSWSRPIFDFGNTVLGDGYNGSGFTIHGAAAGAATTNQHGTVADILFENHRVPNGVSPSQDGNMTICLKNQVINWTFTNIVVRNWNHPSPIPSGGDAGGGGITQKDPAGSVAGLLIINSEFTQETGPQITGKAIDVTGFTVFSNRVHHIPNAIFGDFNAISNYVYEVDGATDPLAHENGIGALDDSVIACNVVSNSVENGIFAWPAWGINSATGTYNTNTGNKLILVYNNVVMSARPGIWISSADKSHATNYGVRAFNNIIRPTAGNYAIQSDSNSQLTKLGLVDIQNNYCITNGGSPAIYLPATSYVIAYNLSNIVQSVTASTAAGYSAANLFMPPDALAITVGNGRSLAANFFSTTIDGMVRSVPWDVGAWQWNGTPPPPEPVFVLRAKVVRAGTVVVP